MVDENTQETDENRIGREHSLQIMLGQKLEPRQPTLSKVIDKNVGSGAFLLQLVNRLQRPQIDNWSEIKTEKGLRTRYNLTPQYQGRVIFSPESIPPEYLGRDLMEQPVSPKNNMAEQETPEIDVPTLDFIYKSIMLVGVAFSFLAAIFVGFSFQAYVVSILFLLVGGFLFQAYRRGLEPIYVRKPI